MEEIAPELSAPPAAPAAGRGRNLALCAVLAALVLGAGAGRALWHVCGHMHDDAIYLSTARALAEGRGYRLIDLPGAPAQTKYPPLYPALLAVLWTLWPTFPDNLVLIKGLSLVCAAGLVVSSYLYLTRFGYISRPVALGGCLLAGTAHLFVYFSTAAMSEMLFGVVCVALFWRLDRLRERPAPGLAADALTGVLLALPFLCRSIGIVFLPLGVGLLCLWGRPFWRVAAVAALASLPWVAWALRSTLAWSGDPVEGYYTDYLGWWASFGPPVLGRVMLANALGIGAHTAALPAEGSVALLDWLNPHLPLIVFLPAGLVGLAALLRRLGRRETLPVLLTAYLLVVLVWPWQPTRFLLPFAPALAGFVLAGLGELARPRLGALRTARLGVAVVAFALAANLVHDTQQAVTGHRIGATVVDDPHQPPVAWADREHVFDWVRAHTDEGDVLASGSDAMLGIYTHRRAFYPVVCSPLSYIYGVPPRKEDDDLEKSLAGLQRHRPRFLVVMPGFHGEDDFRAWVGRPQGAYPERVRPVYVGADPRFTIYELSYPLGSASERVSR